MPRRTRCATCPGARGGRQRPRRARRALPATSATGCSPRRGDVFNPDADARRRRAKEQRRREKDEQAATRAGRAGRDRHPRAAPPAGVPLAERVPADVADAARARADGDDAGRTATGTDRHCYVCKRDYTQVHHFYDQLCPPCGDAQLREADRDGRPARATSRCSPAGGSRSATRPVSSCSAPAPHLIVTTRFPRDAAVRFAREPDFADWRDRLEVFGLDLRHTPSVEAFCAHLVRDPRPARLHRQQRLPDGAPPARVLPPHARARDRRRRRRCRRTLARCSASTTASAGTEVLQPATTIDAHRELARDRHRVVPASRAGRAVAAAPARRRRRARRRLFPEGGSTGPAAGRPARAQQVAADARRGVDGRAARGPARQRGRAVRPQRAAQAAAAARAGPRQAHRQRVGDGGPVLPAVQDHKHPHTNMAKAALNMMTRTSAADYAATAST